jgi:uncharacterized membrane protein
MEHTPYNISQIIDRFALLLMVVGLLIPAFYYSELPPRIPIHFNWQGRPDWWVGKVWVWMLPCVGVILYNMLGRINFTDSKETGRKAAELRLIQRMMRWVRLFVMASFLYLTWGIIQTARGRWEGLGTYFVPLFLLALFSLLAFYARRIHSVR